MKPVLQASSAASPHPCWGAICRRLNRLAVLLGLAFLASAGLAHPASDTVLAVEPEHVHLLWERVVGHPPRTPWWMATRDDIPCVKIGDHVSERPGRKPGYCGLCVAVSYIIEPTGRTSNRRVLVTVPRLPAYREKQISGFVVDAVRSWRFEPTDNNPNREAVWTRFHYSLVLHDRSPSRDVFGPAHSELQRLCSIEFAPSADSP
jgi:hypothetical protein